MSELEAVESRSWPVTTKSLVEALRDCGLAAGQVVLVHSSLSSLGWVCGGAPTVVKALIEVLNADGAVSDSPQGTLMMPTHTAGNTDPKNWGNPPVPQAWWSAIREEMPAFAPQVTPSLFMGVIPENFRSWPDVGRSAHPVGSFAAIGKHAQWLLEEHTNLEEMFGQGSPIEKLYELDGDVLLLGVDHESNTSLHLAEYRAEYEGKEYIREGSAVMVNGKRTWVEYEMLVLDTDDFEAIGDAFEQEFKINHRKVGNAPVRFFKQRPLVDFAVAWMSKHRGNT